MTTLVGRDPVKTSFPQFFTVQKKSSTTHTHVETRHRQKKYQEWNSHSDIQRNLWNQK